jgi:hypothetical protein
MEMVEGWDWPCELSQERMHGPSKKQTKAYGMNVIRV